MIFVNMLSVFFNRHILLKLKVLICLSQNNTFSDMTLRGICIFLCFILIKDENKYQDLLEN